MASIWGRDEAGRGRGRGREREINIYCVQDKRESYISPCVYVGKSVCVCVYIGCICSVESTSCRSMANNNTDTKDKSRATQTLFYRKTDGAIGLEARLISVQRHKHKCLVIFHASWSAWPRDWHTVNASYNGPVSMLGRAPVEWTITGDRNRRICDSWLFPELC